MLAKRPEACTNERDSKYTTRSDGVTMTGGGGGSRRLHPGWNIEREFHSGVSRGMTTTVAKNDVGAGYS
jgi:hypothetical protein